MSLDTNVQVAVRCRPFNSKERNNGEQSCVKIQAERIALVNPVTNEEHGFAFDLIIDDQFTQEEVWQKIGTPILEKAFSGYNATIFAYGQTGSGKTWSMQGADGDLRGIIPRMNDSLFERIAKEKLSRKTVQFLVTVSYFEIYNEVLFDLLDASDRKKKNATKGGLEIKEHPVLGVYVKGLQECVVDSAPKLQAIIDQGMKNRTTASTQMNADSSRSHSVFVITVHQKDPEDESKNCYAKVNLVDLAGSERVKSTGATGSTLKEGANINKSLSALGNVINALVEASKGKSTFIPYRNSKLTRVLQESLGGNSVTAMLAALSPAACNFEETLSTLKYANRAKDIKIKAVKNEEANQVSKLNDEIRALKEKLQGQGNADTSELEEKHRLQLSELEEAMKSTWQEKVKVSEDHERERQKLVLQQQNAARQLESAKERNWLLLEQKGDLEITLQHVRHTGGDDASVHSWVEDWASSLHHIAQLQQRLVEQETVVQVYRSALEKDNKSLLGCMRQSLTDYDVASVSMLRQVKEKSSALSKEVAQWTKLQDELSQQFELLTERIKHSVGARGSNQNELSDEELKELQRGLSLLQKQCSQQRMQHNRTIASTRRTLTDFSAMSTDLAGMLQQLASKLQKSDAALTFSETRAQKHLTSISEALQMLSAYTNALSSLSASDSSSPLKGVHSDANADEVEIGIKNITVESNFESVVQLSTVKAGGQVLLDLDADSAWAFDVQLLNTAPDNNALAVSWSAAQEVRSLTLQGAKLPVSKVNSRGGFVVSKVLAKVDLHCTKLPNGLTFSGCNCDVDITSNALGANIDWPVLLKKSPPEKFLKRPPVRFLFDLVKFIAATFPCFLHSALETATWEAVGADKQTKLDFMEELIRFVSELFDLDVPTTSAVSIVTGGDPELTNKLLQQLAVGLHAFVAADLGSQFQNVSAWVTKATVMLSLDGVDWRFSKIAHIGLNDESGVVTIDLVGLEQDSSKRVARYLKIVPTAWNGKNLFGPAIRFRASGVKPRADALASDNSATGHASKDSEVCSVTSAHVHEVLRSVFSSLDVLGECLAFFGDCDEAMKQRKQEEVKRSMDKLAKEKQALEEMLQNEKQTLANDKQDLTEQVAKLFNQLRETKSLFEREQELNNQLEADRLQLEADKSGLRQSLQEKEETCADMQTEVMRLQANYERDQQLIDKLRRRVKEQEDQLAVEEARKREFERMQQEWEHERDELTNQVQVVTEERDTARQHEEELFEQLTERTNDLDRLQESYVDIADRCNDAQDECSELRDQIETLQEALATRASFQQQRAVLAASLTEMPERVKVNGASSDVLRSNDDSQPHSTQSFVADAKAMKAAGSGKSSSKKHVTKSAKADTKVLEDQYGEEYFDDYEDDDFS